MPEKYLIAHMLSGALQKYHQSLANDIAERFGVLLATRRIGSHLTLKAPFYYEHIVDIEQRLQDFCHSYTSVSLTAQGFGFFGKKVVFLDIHISPEAQEFLAEYNTMLRSLPELTLEPTDQYRKLHATLAEVKNDADFDRIWGYMNQLPRVCYPIQMKDISLLQYESSVSQWQVIRTFSLR